ncbi:hypothetical protein [uncultured Thomasclavelia sp.]|uniref:hypothetical protein n=1 Tax=uncultured Thomasclavelia sp. TaxID=3025759 RepID=UPI0025FFF3E2|nr:hypothetical protein [uncultured Thomasclavelia sp.]
MRLKLTKMQTHLNDERRLENKTNISARMKLNYCRLSRQKMELNLLVIAEDDFFQELFNVELTYLLEETALNDEKTVIAQAVTQLEPRIELILSMLTEEMGFELLS